MLKCSWLWFSELFKCPVTCCSGRSNCNTSFLLLLHPVHGSSTFMSITDFIVNTSIIKNTLCQCCFTSIDMSHDSNISGSLKWIFSSSQGFFLLYLVSYAQPDSVTNPVRCMNQKQSCKLLTETRICNVRMPCLPLPSCAYLLFS